MLRAYNILVGDADPSKEKGYQPSLYEGIRICPPPDKHVHVQASVEFLDALISRAEPELMGKYVYRTILQQSFIMNVVKDIHALP